MKLIHKIIEDYKKLFKDLKKDFLRDIDCTTRFYVFLFICLKNILTFLVCLLVVPISNILIACFPEDFFQTIEENDEENS